MHPPLPGDKAAGYVGLAVGAVSILITVYVIVQLTNRSFASHGAAPHGAPAAGAAHGPPPGGAPPGGAPAPGPPAGAPAPGAPAGRPPAPH